MDFRKSHNFDKNVIAANLADFGADDYSDDDSGDSFGHVSEGSFEDSEEEEVELTELEKESLAPSSGVGEKRPSRALEQIMLGMSFDDDKQDMPILVSDKRTTSRSNSKTHDDSHDKKVEDSRSQTMQGSKTHSQREKSGNSIDDIIKKPKHAGMPIPGTQKKMVSPKGRTSAGSSSVRVRRGKRSELAKSSSEAHRARHHHATGSGAPPISPGRPRSMQHRSQSASDVSSPKPRHMSMQHRGASTGQTIDEEKPDDSLSRGSGHGHSRRRGHRSTTAEHHSGDGKLDDPIPRTSGHGHSRRRGHAPRTTSENHSGDEKPDDPIPRGSGHGRRRRVREHSAEHSDHEEQPADEPIPRGSGHGRRRSGRHAEHHSDDEKPDDPIPRGSGHGKRRQAAAARRIPATPTRQPSAARRVKHATEPMQQHSAEHPGNQDEPADEPIPRGSGHGRRRSGRHAEQHSDDEKPDDAIPRGSGHSKRRQPAAARRHPATPTRRAKHAAEPNAAKLGDSAGLKW